MEETPANQPAYALLDSGGGRVLEQLGNIIAARPCPPAWWRRRLPGADWKKAVDLKREVKEPLRITLGSTHFHLLPAAGGIRALAPELREAWALAADGCAKFAEKQRVPARVLNLFGGVGGMTLAASRVGAAVTHVDASADAIKRARDNAAINTLANRDIRWVVDDPVKFVQRERTQSTRYDLIVNDPQTPRDAKRGGFEPERGLAPLLAAVSGLLSDKALGVLLFCRQGAVSPTTLGHLMAQEFGVFGGRVEHGELLLRGGEGVPAAPAGAYAHWLKNL